MKSTLLPTVTLKPDAEWLNSVSGFKSIAGGILAVVLVLAVIGLVLAAAGLVASKVGLLPPGAIISPDALLRVALVTVLAASLSGAVSWSFNLSLGLGNFTAEAPADVPPGYGVFKPVFDPCATDSYVQLPQC